MRYTKGAIFAGIAVVTVALASKTPLGHFTAAQAEEVPKEENLSVEEINTKTEALEKKFAQLIKLSEEKIEHYEAIYDEQYDKQLRFTYHHITYSSRLVSKEENFIKNNIVVNSYREQPISLDLRTHSAITAYEIDQYVLKGTALEGLGSAYIKAELDYDVNALFLLSLSIHESGWGTSDIARDKNNLFGYGAYDNSPYQSAVSFATKGEGVQRVAKHLSETYLTQDGQYYSGGFTLSHVNKKYASDPKWARKIAKTMDKINKDVMANQDTDYHLEKYAIGENEDGEVKYSYTFKAVKN
ncbi:glucosaminidase domain-containing protein [Bacillus spizizenii]|nr:glucosaminidase domain-containing protein [Bacillus spizizenii]MCY8890402.1 glucosaminidase domain-containing protein [Bacillus spizizenii]MEC0841857.1 glucosaminidase domain-containing protein [Bacillus spizizenii]